MAVIVRGAFWEFSKGRVWAELGRDLLILAGSYITVTIGAFIVNLFHAPVLLDADCQKEIGRLSEQLASPDKAQADHLRALLAKLNDNGKAILNLALFHEELTYKLMEASGISSAVIQDGIRNCLDIGLLHWQNTHPDPTSPLSWMSDVYWISPDIRSPLRRLLYMTEFTKRSG